MNNLQAITTQRSPPCLSPDVNLGSKRRTRRIPPRTEKIIVLICSCCTIFWRWDLPVNSEDPEVVGTVALRHVIVMILSFIWRVRNTWLQIAKSGIPPFPVYIRKQLLCAKHATRGRWSQSAAVEATKRRWMLLRLQKHRAQWQDCDQPQKERPDKRACHNCYADRKQRRDGFLSGQHHNGKLSLTIRSWFSHMYILASRSFSHWWCFISRPSPTLQSWDKLSTWIGLIIAAGMSIWVSNSRWDSTG